ncbi:SDR family NAD(P)-dependent oxidoreductase [Niabella pedocola]|uniref:SDR family NAD(P)-dependent oxidoreductase n=1 Tax=Niabella pedocola TaxID=1752077 RepID=UPI0021D3F2EA|nr:SDR family NAD(P)-dependent oxidoreductase [Niabella pedocola]
MNTAVKGKVVAITGASSGIGRAIALLLGAQGYKVVMGARRQDTCNNWLRKSLPGRQCFLPGNGCKQARRSERPG